MSAREQAIRARLARATDGPWVAVEVRDGRSNIGFNVDSEDGHHVVWDIFGGAIDDLDDALLIANAPEDIAWLLNQLADCREEIAELRAASPSPRAVTPPSDEAKALKSSRRLSERDA